MTAYPVLSVTTFLPLVGAALVLLCGRDVLARWIALATTLATVAVSVPLYGQFDKASIALQFVESSEWIPSWNISYGMGVDGISLPFIMLSTLLSILCVGRFMGCDWNASARVLRRAAGRGNRHDRALCRVEPISFLHLLGTHGHSRVPSNRCLGRSGAVHAAVKFLLFTLSGSVLMLVSLIALYHICGTFGL